MDRRRSHGVENSNLARTRSRRSLFSGCVHRQIVSEKKGAHTWATKGMQSGLRGNVSTYRLNTDDIIKMTNEQLMPPCSSILAATIGVTFVCPKNLPQKTMPGFLRVNITRVRVALQWLKANNPLYQNIIISPDRLNALPLNDVPKEIASLAKFSEDVTLLAEESDDYVPTVEEDVDGKLVTSKDGFFDLYQA